MASDIVRLMNALFLPGAEGCRDTPWRPSVDVYRTPTGWLVKFELAGVRPEDIDLTVAGNHLRIKGSRRDWFVEEGFSHYRMEITYCQFERTLELPCDLEKAHITTECRHGLLLARVELEAEL